VRKGERSFDAYSGFRYGYAAPSVDAGSSDLMHAPSMWRVFVDDPGPLHSPTLRSEERVADVDGPYTLVRVCGVALRRSASRQ